MQIGRERFLAFHLEVIEMYEVPKFNSRDDLLEWLIGKFLAKEPVLITYSWYQQNVLGRYVAGRVNHHAVIRHAMNGPSKHMEGLGTVQLDAFIVDSNSGEPGGGHWERHDLTYNKELWKKNLKGARVLHIRERRKTKAERDKKLSNLLLKLRDKSSE